MSSVAPAVAHPARHEILRLCLGDHEGVDGLLVRCAPFYVVLPGTQASDVRQDCGQGTTAIREAPGCSSTSREGSLRGRCPAAHVAPRHAMGGTFDVLGVARTAALIVVALGR